METYATPSFIARYCIRMDTFCANSWKLLTLTFLLAYSSSDFWENMLQEPKIGVFKGSHYVIVNEACNIYFRGVEKVIWGEPGYMLLFFVKIIKLKPLPSKNIL